MEFDITMRIKVDPTLFLLSPSKEDREDHVLDLIRVAMYECDDIKVSETTVEEVANEY